MDGPVVQRPDLLKEIAAAGNDQLGRRRRGGSPHIGDEIGDGEVDLVAHGAHNGDARGKDGPGHPLVVEGHEVFQRAPSPGHDDHVNAGRFVEEAEGVDDLAGGLDTLHPYGGHQDIHRGEAALRDVQDVPDDGARRRGDDPDPRGEEGKRFLVARVEEPLGLKPGLELLEGYLQGACAPGLGIVEDELVFAAGFVHVDPRTADDAHPVLGIEPEGTGNGPEEHRPDLALLVLEREV